MWQVILCFGITFLILEMMIPGIFFLNFAIAAIVCAILSFFIKSIFVLITVFCVLSIIFIYTLRPLLIKTEKNKKAQTGICAKYVGKTATVVETVDKSKGAISIYDERWQARTKDDEIIEIGQEAEIVDYESIIMYVKKA